MKKNSIGKTAKNEIFSLLSILSIVLVFAAICGSVLAILLQFGAIGLPDFLSNETPVNGGEHKEDDVISALHKRNGSGKELYVPEADGEALKNLIVDTVSSNNIYMRLNCVKISDDDSSTAIYDIWRSGEKFRIAEYDTDGAQKYDVIYNGETLVRIDSDGEERNFDEADYYDISPIPDVSSVLNEKCSVIYTNSDDGEYEAILDDKENGEVFDIIISMSKTRLISLKQFKNNSPRVIIDVLLFSENVDDSIFLQ